MRKTPMEPPVTRVQHLFRVIPFTALQLSLLLIFSGVVNSSAVLGAETCTCTVSWTANTEPDLAGYEIYIGDQPGVYKHPNSPISVGPITSYKFPPGTLVPGVTYYYALKARDFSNNLSGLSLEVQGGLPSVPPPPPLGSGFLQDSGPDGLLVVEAEHAHTNTPQGSHSWVLSTTPAGFSGSGNMTTTPNSGTNHNTNYTTLSPRLDFEVTFVQTGVHYIWVRGWGTTGTDDSVHVGFNGQAIASSDRLSGFTSTWTWSNQTMDGSVATINVPSPGTHTLNLWMREDGTVVDKLLLTTNASLPPPSGTGPAESQEVTP